MQKIGIKVLNIMLIIIITYVFIFSSMPIFAATTYNSGDVVITQSGDYEITNGVTSVKISGNIDVNIVLNNVTIDNSETTKHSFIVTGGANANIVLVGDNTLKAGVVTGIQNSYKSEYGYAGIQVDKESSITIQGTGTLTVQGGTAAAGIGGGYRTDYFYTHESISYPLFTAGKITINSGTINTTGGYQGAGIGGGINGATTSSSITINGGIITTTGGAFSSGIGDGDSTGKYTNPDYYKSGGYEICINGGTIVATGGKCSTGIGTTDYLNTVDNPETGLAVYNSNNSTLRISILSGNVQATGGADTQGDGAAAIGVGRRTVMADNSITIGKDVTLNCVSQSNSSITTNSIENANVPSINLDDESYNLIVRFAAAETERTATIKDADGNVIKTFTVPANYTSVTTELPGAGTYYFVQLDDGTEMKIEVEDGEGLVTGQTDEVVYTKDIVSALLTGIEIRARDGDTSIITSDYTFSPGKKKYNVYTENGIGEIDIYFKWAKSNAEDGVSTVIKIDGVETAYQNENGEYYIKLQKTLTEGTPIEINFMKNDLNSELIAAKYNLVINMSERYELQIASLDKIYDGKEVSPTPTCTGSLFSESDIGSIEYVYYNNADEELMAVPKNVGSYKVKASLRTGTYIAESEIKPFEITQRKVSISSIGNYVKTEDGTIYLSDIQKEGLGLVVFNDAIAGDVIGITYNTETSCYDLSTVEAMQITLYDVTVTNTNYTIDPTQVVYGEITSGLQTAIFTSDAGESWTKTLGTQVKEDCDIHNITVKAKTVGQGESEAIYSADVEWGNMNFVYSKGGWDTVEHEYADGVWSGMDGENNKISVTNRSNRPIELSVSGEIEFQYSYDIKLGLSENNISKYDAQSVIANNEFSKVIPYKQNAETENTVRLYTVLQGTMPDVNTKTKIGTLTLNLAISE